MFNLENEGYISWAGTYGAQGQQCAGVAYCVRGPLTDHYTILKE